MSETRTTPWPLLAIGLTVVIGAFAWLVFALGGQHAGGRRLVDVPEAQLDVLPHGDAQFGLAEVVARPEGAWAPWTAPGYLSVPHGEVIWLRVRLANPGPAPVRGVLADTSYFSDRVDAWQADGAGGWRHAMAGDAVAGDAKPVWGRTAAFPVGIPAAGVQVLYLRVSDAYIAHVQLVWWAREEDFFSALVRNVMAECACYGALLALVFYNLVLWLRLRFADLGWYVISAGASAACNLLANATPALAGLPLGSPWHETLVAAAFAVSALGMLQFTRVFLGTAELLPRADRALRGWRWVLLAGAAGAIAMPWMATPNWLGAVVLLAALNDVSCVAVALAAWRRGAAQARFFVLAYALLLVAAVPLVISALSTRIVAGTALSLLAGRTIEMLLLSFAVAERFARTQRKLVEETEQRRLIEETYAEELEIEVGERTRELAEANADKDRMLAVVGHDLRSPLTGLMRAADGTAGDFAREVSRTGRTLLLLIEDLVLWARLRAGLRQPAAHPAAAVTAPAVALHRALAEQGGLELAVAVSGELRVVTDLVLAQTLLRNLLANALKFARARVTLRAEAAGGGVRFTVGNDGPPLAPAVAARFAAGENEPLSATGGLGLRLCREICGALGSRLEAGTAPDGTTEFHFILPAAPATRP